MRHAFVLLAAPVAALMAVAGSITPAHAVSYDIDGSVSSSNGPIAKGRVAFYATCQDYAAGISKRSVSFTDGEYSTTLAEGTYLALITPSSGTGAITSWHAARPSCDQATPVEVTDDDTIDLLAAPLAIVTGAVSSAAGQVNSATVNFYSDCAYPSVAHSSLSYGLYTVTVSPGVYRVLIRPGDSMPAIDSWHDTAATCEQATPVTITGSARVDLRAIAVFTLSGDVTSRNGAVTHGSVDAFATCEAPAAVDHSRLAPGFSLQLPPGQYWLRITTTGSKATTSWNGAATTCAASVPVTVAASTSTPLTTLALQRAPRPPRVLRGNRSYALPKKSKQGVRLTWKTSGQKVCRVTKGRVTGITRGRCRLTATAPAAPGLAALTQKFISQVPAS